MRLRERQKRQEDREMCRREKRAGKGGQAEKRGIKT